MLDYLANIMEDASDFSWDLAKACHATRIVADRLSRTDIDKIDRIRRAHAQWQASGAQTSASPLYFKKNKDSH